MSEQTGRREAPLDYPPSPGVSRVPAAVSQPSPVRWMGGIARQSQTNLGPEPAALKAVAANTRLAMAGGAAYLRESTPSNTPAELAEPIKTLAAQLQDIAQHFFVGETSANPEQAGRMAAANETTMKLAELCK